MIPTGEQERHAGAGGYGGLELTRDLWTDVGTRERISAFTAEAQA